MGCPPGFSLLALVTRTHEDNEQLSLPGWPDPIYLEQGRQLRRGPAGRSRSGSSGRPAGGVARRARPRATVFQRAGWAWSECRSEPLTLHQYSDIGPDEETAGDMVVLCRTCHVAAHPEWDPEARYPGPWWGT